MRMFLTAVAAGSLLAAPVVHASTPTRAAASIESTSELGGGMPLSAIIVLLAILGGAIFLAVDGDDSPDSP